MNIKIKSTATINTLKSIEKITGGKLTLGKLIWAIRESDEIPQNMLAEKLGISKQHLCDIEHGRKSVSPGLAATYAKKLGYSPEHFIQLALQGIADRDGLNVIVKIIPNFDICSRRSF
jgi:DNA-binding XRE family transcriptional regulator